MSERTNKVRLCRLCRNTADWRYPTGDKQGEGGFLAENGFGGEEWLGRREWVLRDENGQEWRYAHIQSMARIAEQEESSPVTLLLFVCERGEDGLINFSIVGTIHQAWRTNQTEAREAVEAFIARGWLRTMREEAAHAGGKVDELKDKAVRALPRWHFTIRFRPDSLEWFDPPLQLLNQVMRAKRMWRPSTPYIWEEDFLPATATAIAWAEPTEQELARYSEATRLRRAISAKEFLPRQAPIQNLLAMKLATVYGPQGYQVRCEDHRVDITVRKEGYASFLEIKPADSAREAIRLALGQLLEYAHYPKADRADNLVVVSDAAPGADDRWYIQRLRQRYGIPLRYVYWPEGAEEISPGELAKCVEVPGRKS